ncbi:MAG: DUF3570 domain-containing protein [Myxococcales bacterium]|nr:DUF3570 domain-containing protein [Myxococcales bacterium]
MPPQSQWTNVDAYQAAAAGAVAAQVGKFDECVEKDKASIEAEDKPSTRLHLTVCLMRVNKDLEALQNSQKVLKEANEKHEAALADFARRRTADILPRIAHIAFFIPQGVDDLKLTFDGKEVPTEKANKKFAVDPGEHNVHAEGAMNGISLTFDKTYELSEGGFITAAIALVPKEAEYLSSGQLNCVLTAKTQKEVFKCLPQGGNNLVVRAGLEVSGYTDTDHTEVIAPRLTASVVSPTAGWNVSGSYMVDVVSAASPDIVSEASPPFHEMRHAGTLSAGYKPGKFGVQASGHISDEPDYLSLGGGIALTTDLNDKLITPSISYDFTNDTIGRGGTPTSVFSHTFQTHEIDVGVAFIMDPKTLLIVGGGLQFERGDQSKPYRYIPMFDPKVAPNIPAGASVDLVNATRLSVRPLEQLPLARDRYSIGARVAHRFKSSTLRLEERLYRDSWEQQATTTDLKYLVDVGKSWLVWPHARFNLQNGSSFYKLAYSAPVSATTSPPSITLPQFRTDDREEGPLYTVVGGLGAKWDLSGEESSVGYSLTLQADVMYNHYFDALFITSRTAIYSTLGFEAEFQ